MVARDGHEIDSVTGNPAPVARQADIGETIEAAHGKR